MLKKLLFLLAVMLTVTVVGIASAAEKGGRYTLTISPEVWSKYITDGVPPLYSDTVGSISGTLQLPSGLYLGLWVQTDLEHESDMSPNLELERERDYYAGLILIKGGFLIDGKITFYDYSKLNDEFGLCLKVSKDIDISRTHSITPFLKGELVIPLYEGENGILGMIGLPHLWKACKKAGFYHEAVLYYYDKPSSTEYGFVGQYNAQVIWHPYEIFRWEPLKYITVNLPKFKYRYPLDINNAIYDPGSCYAFGGNVVFEFSL